MKPWHVLMFAALSSCTAGQLPTFAKDSSQWAQATPERREFFRKAWRPDYGPTSSCCGEADAYEADEYEFIVGELYAIITEGDSPMCWTDEDGGQVCKPKIATGTKILVPLNKVLLPPPTEPRNTTGHGIIWIAGNGKDVFCYALPGGM